MFALIGDIVFSNLGINNNGGLTNSYLNQSV